MAPISKKYKVAPVGKHIVARLFTTISEQGLEAIGKYYGNYRAFVYSIDDPENCDRIQVSIPTLTGDAPYEVWFYPKNNFAGKNYGVQCLPQVGDMVWVSFEMGDIDGGGIWEHGHWGRDEKPTDDKDLDDKDSYWFITPKGHKIIFNDTKDVIYVKHQGGTKIKITKDTASIEASKAISLGQLDGSDEPGVLGNKNEDALNALADGILGIIDAFSNSQVLTDYSGAGLKASLIALTASVKASMETFKNTTSKSTKSKKITLD